MKYVNHKFNSKSSNWSKNLRLSIKQKNMFSSNKKRQSFIFGYEIPIMVEYVLYTVEGRKEFFSDLFDTNILEQ